MNGRARWFPALPLVEALEQDRKRCPLASIIDRSGVDRRTWERLRYKTRVRMDTADRLAVALGRHPTELWPDWSNRRPAEQEGSR